MGHAQRVTLEASRPVHRGQSLAYGKMGSVGGLVGPIEGGQHRVAERAALPPEWPDDSVEGVQGLIARR